MTEPTGVDELENMLEDGTKTQAAAPWIELAELAEQAPKRPELFKPEPRPSRVQNAGRVEQQATTIQPAVAPPPATTEPQAPAELYRTGLLIGLGIATAVTATAAIAAIAIYGVTLFL